MILLVANANYVVAKFEQRCACTLAGSFTKPVIIRADDQAGLEGVLPALGWIARGAMKAATTGALPAAAARGGVSVGVNALEHQAA